MFRSCRSTVLSCAVAAAMLSGCNVETVSQFATVDESGNVNAHPVLAMRGSANMTLVQGATFVDPGVTALDFEDGDLSAQVVSDAHVVNTDGIGLYKITYRVTDSGNASATPIVRTVMVVAADADPDEQLVTVPAITGIEVYGFTDQGEIATRTPLADQSTLILAEQPTDRFNLVAISDDESRTGSVHFALEGPVSIDRIENNAIYTMANEADNLSIAAGDLPDGDYVLYVTPYDETDGEGIPGQTLTLNFRVLAAAPVTEPGSPEPETPIVDNGVPGIVSLKLVTMTPNSGALVDYAALEDGAVLDARDLPSSLVNVVALSQDVSATGSVHFDLQGPQPLARHENDAIYTMAIEQQGWNVSGPAAAGDYSLTVTPYELPNMGGAAGQALSVSFSLTHTDAVAETPDADETVVDDDEIVTDTVTPTPPPVVETPPVLDDDFTPRPVTAMGFTPIKPSAGSKLIYVSSSQGNDSNDCLSAATPCASIKAGTEKMRAGQPDHLYLKAGDTWRGQPLGGVQSGRSAAEPAVVAFYGTGPRPKLETANNKVLNYPNRGLQHVNFIGLHLKAYKHDPAHPQFTGHHNDGDKAVFLGGHTNVLLEDMVFDHMEIAIQDWNGGVPTDITLRRNIFTGAYYNQSSNDRNSRPSNLYAKGVNGLVIVENVFDHGGWHPTVKGAGANMYNHNLYLQYENVGNKVVVRDNIITRASSHGVHGRPGGTYENNFFGRNTVSLQMGYNQHPMPNGTFARALRNVITEGHSMIKGQAPCVGNNLCTPARWALHTADIGGAQVTVKDNVIHSSAPGDTQWSSLYSDLKAFGLGLDLRNPGQTAQSGNIVWKWANASEGTGVNYPAPGRTLGDYYQQLSQAGTVSSLQSSGYVKQARTGSDHFDSFMNLVLSRELQQWNDNLTAEAINDYIRAGFGK